MHESLGIAYLNGRSELNIAVQGGGFDLAFMNVHEPQQQNTTTAYTIPGGATQFASIS